MNRYLPRWNEILAPLEWSWLPFTSRDEAAFTLCEVRDDPAMLEKLLGVFPSGFELFERLWQQLELVPRDAERAKGPGPGGHPVSVDELASWAHRVALGFSALTGETVLSIPPQVVRRPSPDDRQWMDLPWSPIEEHLGDLLADVFGSFPPRLLEAADLATECVYHLECDYALAHYVLWPYYASAFPGPCPHEELLALQNAGARWVGIDDAGRVGLVL